METRLKILSRIVSRVQPGSCAAVVLSRKRVLKQHEKRKDGRKRERRSTGVSVGISSWKHRLDA